MRASAARVNLDREYQNQERKDDGTPNRNGSRAYLYFDNGMLTGVQRFGD